jgi:choline dehydrogenase-like flavoprotein
MSPDSQNEAERNHMLELTDTRREILANVYDTAVPAIARDPDRDGFFARKASDLWVPQVVEYLLAGMPEDQRASLLALLDTLDKKDFARRSPRSREQIMREVSLSGPNVARAIDALRALTLFLFYGLPDERGQNPNWSTLGYPGPIAAAPAVEKPLDTYTPDGDTTLEADVCVVGSGAGGGVIAGVLSAQGLTVVVLEAGGYFDDADFNQLEIPAYQNLYWRGGPTPTADTNVSLLAGCCLGGGTVVNWTNSLRPTPRVREQWQREFGLEGLAGSDFDQHVDAVWDRLQVNDRCSQINHPQQLMKAGAEKLGWSFKPVQRNTDERHYSFETAGYLGFGDPTGAKQSTVKTYLQDAHDRGAVLLTRCWAQRILVQRDHAVGVEATWADPETGRRAQVTVHAPQVVVAGGALESPALLMRSGIGGPAVGHHLHLHPATATVGFYDDDLEAWKGAPQAGLIDEFENVEQGHGFLIESPQYTTALAASALPYTDAQTHKRLMSNFRKVASFFAVLRDHGHGQVTIDRAGSAVTRYSLTDKLDVHNAQQAIDAQARLHAAAGAQQILATAADAQAWRRGEDLDQFITRAQRIPPQAGGWKLFSAHQMGTCRMGTDPRSSVAGPWGELHDVSGVWIGDASTFPTATGTNPMITIMALAHRNAQAIAAATPTPPAQPAHSSPHQLNPRRTHSQDRTEANSCTTTPSASAATSASTRFASQQHNNGREATRGAEFDGRSPGPNDGRSFKSGTAQCSPPTTTKPAPNRRRLK